MDNLSIQEEQMQVQEVETYIIEVFTEAWMHYDNPNGISNPIRFKETIDRTDFH